MSTECGSQNRNLKMGAQSSTKFPFSGHMFARGTAG